MIFSGCWLVVVIFRLVFGMVLILLFVVCLYLVLVWVVLCLFVMGFVCGNVWWCLVVVWVVWLGWLLLVVVCCWDCVGWGLFWMVFRWFSCRCLVVWGCCWFNGCFWVLMCWCVIILLFWLVCFSCLGWVVMVWCIVFVIGCCCWSMSVFYWWSCG